MQDPKNKDANLPLCKYGSKCYRKNANHLKRFHHDNDGIGQPPQKCQKSSEPVVNSGEMQDSTKNHNIMFKLTDLHMSDDFYDLWELAKSIKSDSIYSALYPFELVGAYDILGGRFDNKLDNQENSVDLLQHYRYRQDPIEAQTVAVCEFLNLHIAYWRDDDKQRPDFVCTIAHDTEHFPKIHQKGENLFSAMLSLIAAIENRSDIKCDRTRMGKIKDLLTAAATKHGHILGDFTDKMKKRKSQVVASTLHNLGIVVPFDRKSDVGYRPLPETNASLRKILNQCGNKDEMIRQKNIDKIEEIVNYVQFANDESDFGMGLELGHDVLHCGHKSLDRTALNLLTVAYQLLNRPVFKKIATTFIRNRHTNWKLSLLD